MVGASRVLRVRTRARAASRSREIYAEPADALIAGFSGSPRTADEPANPALGGRTTEATSLGDGVRLLWRPGTRGIGLVSPLLLATVRVNSGATGALDAAAVKAITIPASTLTVVCTERPGRRRLQLAGFVGQCLAFLALGGAGPMPLAKLASRGREVAAPHRRCAPLRHDGAPPRPTGRHQERHRPTVTIPPTRAPPRAEMTTTEHTVAGDRLRGGHDHGGSTLAWPRRVLRRLGRSGGCRLTCGSHLVAPWRVRRPVTTQRRAAQSKGSHCVRLGAPTSPPRVPARPGRRCRRDRRG